MFINIPFKALAKPSNISTLAVAFSFLAWEFPSFGILRKGFDTQEQLDVVSVVTLALWYGLIGLTFLLGQELGKIASTYLGIRTSYPPLGSDMVYRCFTLFAACGTGAMVLKVIQSLSLQLALLSIATGQANLLGIALREHYSFGIVSLRYLVVYSASLSLCQIIERKRISFLNLLNLLMLILNSTARMLLIATTLITFFLLNSEKRFVRLNIVKAVGFGVFLFLSLSIVNYSRNFGYYQSTGHSFWGAGISEMITYLGSPFQVAVGSAKVLDLVVVGGGQTYRNYVDIEEALNTNTAFVLLHEQIGYLAWPYIALICSSMGFLFALMRSLGKTSFLLPCGAILYGASELWRLNLFQEGIFITWVICGIGIPLSLMIVSRIHAILAKAYPLHLKTSLTTHDPKNTVEMG